MLKISRPVLAAEVEAHILYGDPEDVGPFQDDRRVFRSLAPCQQHHQTGQQEVSGLILTYEDYRCWGCIKPVR